MMKGRPNIGRGIERGIGVAFALVFTILACAPVAGRTEAGKGRGKKLRLYFKPRPRNSLPLPRVGEVAVWEAERARRRGEWKLCQEPTASGGIYVRPLKVEGAELEFVFETKEPVNIRVWPVLFRHSDRRPARRFPYPLEHRPGPDVIDYLEVGGKRVLYFTSPEAGWVVAFDPDSLKVIKAVRLGGFLADLVAAKGMGRVVVADALRGRVYILRPNLEVERVASLPSAPWSLALHEGRVYVACLEGRKVVALDLASGAVEAEVALPFKPVHVDVVGEGGSARLVVWPLPFMFDLETMRVVPSHKERLPFERRESAEIGRRGRPGYRRVYRLREGVLRVEVLTEKGWQRKDVDVREVTGEPRKAGLKPPLPDTVGPDVMDIVGGRVFFTSPITGRVGVVDILKMELVGSIEVGGILSDLAEGPGGTVLVADAEGRRVVVIDAGRLKVEREVELPGTPVSLGVYQPPGYVKGAPAMCFVALWGEKKVVRIDPRAGKVDWEGELPAEPWLMLPLKPPSPGWWPLIPSDRLHLEAWRNYLAVLLAPRAFGLERLEPLGPDTSVHPRWSKRSEVAFDIGGGREKVFRVDNYHTIQVVLREAETGRVLEGRWVDVSRYTDWQLLPSPRPLSPMDSPGPLTVSVDGGPEFPWRREIWMTPDQEQFLVAESEEFWRWNAPVFSVPAGRHVVRLKAYSPYVQIDALKVERTLKGWVDIEVEGSPPEGEALAKRYRSVFYDKEPVRLKVRLKNNLEVAQEVLLSYVLRDYMGEVLKRGSFKVALGPRAEASTSLDFAGVDATGTMTLVLVATSRRGQSVVVHRLLKVPKLTRPRMLFRPEDIPLIEARIRKHRRLFDRFFDWLRRHCDEPGFLPAGITKATFVPKLPKDKEGKPIGGGWRRYDLGWRMLCLQFAAMFDFNPERRSYFQKKVAQMLKDGRADYYCTFHHHGPFFPGAVASLFDMVASVPGQAPEEVRRLHKFFHRYLGDMNVLPWMLAALSEPLTPRERAILWHLGMWLLNVERYFDLHQGRRGGRRWLNIRTGCHCPYGAFAYSFLYLRNFLKEPRFHEKKIIWGFINHSSLARTIHDRRRICGREADKNPPPNGEPIKWIDDMLAKHPLEKWRYMEKFGFRRLIQRLEAEGTTPDEVDEVLSYPPQASSNNPVPFVVPLGLALGWFDPEAPEVRQDELPPTMIFDVEGDVIMRSDWGPDATEVFFTCGIRDHVYRHQPTHLRIGKAGEFLLGEAASIADDGNPGPGKSWGNVVVIEPSKWLERWGENFWHPRGEEYCLINRFSDPTFRYIVRGRRLVGYAPAEGGYGGGLDFHGHTQSFLVKEGEIVAFETWPEFDYVAGDATNSWPLGLAEEVYRQVVFVKPDVVVVYDRVKLGPKAKRAYWVSATGPELEVAGDKFLVGSGDSSMVGHVLLPQKCTMKTFSPTDQNKYSTPPPFAINWFLFDGRTRHQKVLEIHPAVGAKRVEFLVVMRVGKRRAGSVLIGRGADGWLYTADYPESEPPPDSAGRKWFEPGYDDSQWRRGKAPLGYGDEDRAKYGTRLEPRKGFLFLRRRFVLERPLPPRTKLILRVASDDSAKVYINGKVADVDPLFGKYPGHEFAYWNREVVLDPGLLKVGENVIAVHVFNVKKSSDIYFDLELATIVEPSLELKGLRGILDRRYAGAEFEYEGRRIRIRFRRDGPVGGDIVINGRGRRIVHEFVREIDDSYRHWKDHPMFRKWMTEPRFRFFIPEEDRRRFGGG